MQKTYARVGASSGLASGYLGSGLKRHDPGRRTVWEHHGKTYLSGT